MLTMPALSNNLTARERLIVALDVDSMEEAERLMVLLKDEVGMFKIGLELFTSVGPALFELVRKHGVKVFFDGKFHDIPNTVAGACRAAVRHNVDMFNIHALGGAKMMCQAAKATAEAAVGKTRPALIAVTILTSMDEKTLAEDLKVNVPLKKMVPYLAGLARGSGLDGVVASAQEAPAIREAVGEDFLIVTPGIRPAFAKADDQARIVTPKDAIAGGADYIVVGRPILKAESPVDAARRVVEEVHGAY